MRNKILILLLNSIIITALLFTKAESRCYEPPINIFFIVHIEPMDWGGGVPYEERMNNLEELMQVISAYGDSHAKFTILMNGDFMELVMANSDSVIFAEYEAQGHELGGHDHGQHHIGYLEWEYPDNLSCRYGQPVFNWESTHTSWADVTGQLDRLTNNKHSMCACAFLCSNEGELAQENGYLLMPGNRSEKCLDYTGKLMRHPMRPAANDLYGHEIEEDLNSPIIYLDHYAQFGKEDAHGYNSTYPAMVEALEGCYYEWLERESSDLDSLDYYVWNFGILTHIWSLNQYIDQIEEWFAYLDQYFINQYTPRGNLIARYATCWDIGQEFIEWENSHPGWSSFNYVKEYSDNLKINEVMYYPEGNNVEYEWLEIFNPTEEIYDLTRWRIRGCEEYWYWSIPEGTIQPGQYLVIARDGDAFNDLYGFYPDYEAYGNSPAINLEHFGDLEFHVLTDAVILQDTTPSAPQSELNWVDVYSWGSSWHAGFCDTQQVEMGHTIARDSFSTDTDTQSDWKQDGRNSEIPTPGRKNYTPLYANFPGKVPMGYAFSGNYPNPFNSKTAFRFTIPVKCAVSLEIYNIAGQSVKTLEYGNFEEGTHFVQLSLEDLSSGLYLYRFNLGEEVVSGKMLYVK